MTNQNSWIEAMKEEWKKPEYAECRWSPRLWRRPGRKSYREMQGW